MKVLLINGSPNENGTTARALSEVASTLNINGIDTEIICVGKEIVRGCIACKGCYTAGRCVQKGDIVNQLVEKINEADGLIVGSPVYYASINGTLKSILDRVFYSKTSFENKPAAAVAVARRAGTTATLDIINKYFLISSMPVVSSCYWNLAHGSNWEDCSKDEEGLQTMRRLGENMAWLIKCIKLGEDNGVKLPKIENKIKTNFIR